MTRCIYCSTELMSTPSPMCAACWALPERRKLYRNAQLCGMLILAVQGVPPVQDWLGEFTEAFVRALQEAYKSRDITT